MTATGADRWCGRIVELAARVLPAEQRQRYAREFIAELHGMSLSQQYRYSAQVLAHAWALRAALTRPGRRPPRRKSCPNHCYVDCSSIAG